MRLAATGCDGMVLFICSLSTCHHITATSRTSATHGTQHTLTWRPYTDRRTAGGKASRRCSRLHADCECTPMTHRSTSSIRPSPDTYARCRFFPPTPSSSHPLSLTSSPPSVLSQHHHTLAAFTAVSVKHRSGVCLSVCRVLAAHTDSPGAAQPTRPAHVYPRRYTYTSADTVAIKSK